MHKAPSASSLAKLLFAKLIDHHLFVLAESIFNFTKRINKHRITVKAPLLVVTFVASYTVYAQHVDVICKGPNL